MMREELRSAIQAAQSPVVSGNPDTVIPVLGEREDDVSTRLIRAACVVPVEREASRCQIPGIEAVSGSDPEHRAAVLP